jgi:DNA-binding response OmpR family regulator
MTTVVPSGTPQAEGSGPPQRHRILIVVDDPDLATTCRRYLERLGYIARIVLAPPDARAVLEDGWADLVILDLQFAGRADSLALLARLARPPVLVCTGRASEAARQQALVAGAVTYLAKPFSLSELRAAVERGLADLHGGPTGP